MLNCALIYVAAVEKLATSCKSKCAKLKTLKITTDTTDTLVDNFFEHIKF